MNKANHFYWLAKSYEREQQNIARDFVKECLKEFKEDAAEGCFSATIYRNNVPESILFDFDELVTPLFLEEGFKVEEYTSPRYGYNSGDDGWTISWDLKKENIQHE